MRQDKFKQIILPLTDKLFRLALRITGNKEDAEDVVQDALFNIWRKKEEWNSIENLEAYCFRSTRNIALDKLSLRENRTEAIPPGYDKPDLDGNIQVQIEKREQIEELEGLIRRLPEKQQTIFHLREVENFSYREIADILKITEEQVKVGLFRARQKLRSFLEE